MLFKLYNTDGEVAYKQDCQPEKFKFMKFLRTAQAKNPEEEFDIIQSIAHINKTNGMEIKRVMVVDDEEILLKAYEQYLTRLSHYFEAFPNASEARVALEKKPNGFDFILVDQSMSPGENGSEFAKRAYNINQSTKVCIITGDTGSVDTDVFDFPNVIANMAKPINKFTFELNVGNGNPFKHSKKENSGLIDLSSSSLLDLTIDKDSAA